MTGVEILATEEVATKFTFNWTVGLITMAIVAIVLTFVSVFFIFGDPDEWVYWVFSIIWSLLIGALVGAKLGEACKTPTDYETQYKVTTSDEVLMNEFSEKYEVIEQDGKIYTVRERE